mmetsp:Transcript_3902/g.11723  ORF Transcript_3902/g.11723 Transcript_3902/m.11723 type:complete len:261 (+) Transcript_3902:617-1399(+)
MVTRRELPQVEQLGVLLPVTGERELAQQGAALGRERVVALRQLLQVDHLPPVLGQGPAVELDVPVLPLLLLPLLPGLGLVKNEGQLPQINAGVLGGGLDSLLLHRLHPLGAHPQLHPPLAARPVDLLHVQVHALQLLGSDVRVRHGVPVVRGLPRDPAPPSVELLALLGLARNVEGPGDPTAGHGGARGRRNAHPRAASHGRLRAQREGLHPLCVVLCACVGLTARALCLVAKPRCAAVPLSPPSAPAVTFVLLLFHRPD